MKKLTLAGSIVTTVGLIIGAAIFLLLPYLAGLAGQSLWLAFVLAGVPTALAGLYLMQMASTVPVSGAHFICISRFISPTVGVMTSFSALICLISLACMVSSGLGQYVALLVPGVNPTVVAVGALVFFSGLNLLGLRFFEILQGFMFLLLVAGILAFAFLGLGMSNDALREPFMPKGVGSFVIAMAIATNAWLGIVGVTEIAGSIDRPERNIPVSILISVVVVGILYFLMAYSFTGLVSWQEAGKIGPSGVLEVAKERFPAWGTAMVAIGAIMSMATTINAFVLLVVSVMNPMAATGVLSKRFKVTSPKSGMPIFSILTYTAVAIVVVIVAGGELEKYALISVQAVMVYQICGATSVLRMPSRAPELFSRSSYAFGAPLRWSIWTVCTLAFVAMMAFGFMADLWLSLSYFLILAISYGYWHARKRVMNRRGVDIEQEIGIWVRQVS